jgi:acid stress-induced BolA-like protein IbaG/YrbA
LRLGARRLEFFALAEVGGEGHHFAVVGILQPLEDDRGVQTAGIGENDLRDSK